MHIPDYLVSIGFEISFDSKSNSFHGTYTNPNGFDLTIVSIDSIIGIQASYKDLTKSVLSASEINSVSELVYILSKSIYLKKEFNILFLKIAQSHISLNAKLP